MDRGGDVRNSLTQAAYSFSRITTFEQCARRFRYRYIDGVKEAFRGVEAFMGQQVHAVLEWLFQERDRGAVRTLEEAVAFYCDQWDHNIGVGRGAVRVIKENDSLEAQRRSGAEMVASFYRTRFLADRLETIANEKHFMLKLADRYSYQGFIDRLARDADGLIHVIDYKTGRARQGSFGGKEADQLESYALAIFADTEVEQMELVLEFLRPGKVFTRRVYRDDAPKIERSLLARIRDVEGSTVFPPQPGVLCRWCGYNDICDASGLGQRALPLGL